MRYIKKGIKKKKTTMLFLCLSPVIPPIPSIRPNLPVLFSTLAVHINTKVMSLNIQNNNNKKKLFICVRQGLCVATFFCFCNGEVMAQVKRRWKIAFFRPRANSYTATQVSVNLILLLFLFTYSCR